MHKAAEYGIAAHWKYKEASDGKKVEAQESFTVFTIIRTANRS